MKSKVVIPCLIIILLAGCNFTSAPGIQLSLSLNRIGNMKIASPAFTEGQDIPSKFTCDGQNINPDLQIGNIPIEAKSLVIIVDDPDSPGGNWSHWLVWNIKPDTSVITEDSIPEGAVEGTTDFGEAKYSGPCPGRGKHHYQYKIYALDTKLDLIPTKTKKYDLEKAMEGHILDRAILIGLYQRK